MNETDNKPKFIKFNDGRQGLELEVLADELAKWMPKEARGKLAPSVLWIARHFKTMHDDWRVNLERVSEMERQVSQLTKERDQQKVDLETVREENDRLRKQVKPRSLEQAREMIRQKQCPVCGDTLYEHTSQGGRSYVSCRTCNFYLNGTAEDPQIERQRR